MIIGITGAAGAGKDTIADILVEEYGYYKLPFADTLKDSVCALFDVTRPWLDIWKNDPEIRIKIERMGIDEEEIVIRSFSVREFLQRYGVEAHRDVFGEGFWIRAWDESPKDRTHANFVIPDVRFENEAAFIRNVGCQIIHVVRGQQPDDAWRTHVSESGIPEQYITHVVRNNGTLEELRENIISWYEDV